MVNPGEAIDRITWFGLLNLVTEDEKAALRSQWRRAYAIIATGLLLTLALPIVVVFAVAVNNPTPSQNVVYDLYLYAVLSTIPGAVAYWAGRSMLRRAYAEAQVLARGRRPELFGLDGRLLGGAGTSPSRWTPVARASTIKVPMLSCPNCGTRNRRYSSRCRKCATPLPLPP